MTHLEGGVRYRLNVTKSMFSAGNGTEKERVGRICCRGDTVLDLYAGIGYFVLPYLVRGGRRTSTLANSTHTLSKR